MCTELQSVPKFEERAQILTGEADSREALPKSNPSIRFPRAEARLTAYRSSYIPDI